MLKHLSVCSVPHLPDVPEGAGRVERFTVKCESLNESHPAASSVTITRCVECGQQTDQER